MLFYHSAEELRVFLLYTYAHAHISYSSVAHAEFASRHSFIIGNEAAERFPYYGMRAIRVVFMTQALMRADGSPDVMTVDEANGCVKKVLLTVNKLRFLALPLEKSAAI